MKIEESIKDKKSIYHKFEQLKINGFEPDSQNEILVPEKAEEIDLPVALREKIQNVLEKHAVILDEFKYADLLVKTQMENLISGFEKIDKEIEDVEKSLKYSESAELKNSLEGFDLSEFFKENKANDKKNLQKVESNPDKIAQDVENKKALKIAQKQRRNSVEKINNLRKFFSENEDEEWKFKGKSNKKGAINNYFLNNKKYREASEEIAMRLDKVDPKINQESKNNNSLIRINFADQNLLKDSNNRKLRSHSFLFKNKENKTNLYLKSKTLKSKKDTVGLAEKNASNNYSLKCNCL